MEIKITRTLDDIKGVLKDSESLGPQTVYWVFSGLNQKIWKNMTVTVPGTYNGEFPKTYGHYHLDSDPTEIYRVIHGKGVFILQKKRVTDGKIIQDAVDEVILIYGDAGDEIRVPRDYAHSWSNVGDSPLITFDNWEGGHDYLPIKNQRGLAYYLINEGGSIKAVKNPEYKVHPKPLWMTAEEFKSHKG